MNIIEEVKNEGFDCGIAIATEAEVEAGAACGQISLLINDLANE